MSHNKQLENDKTSNKRNLSQEKGPKSKKLKVAEEKEENEEDDQQVRLYNEIEMRNGLTENDRFLLNNFIVDAKND